MANEAQNKLTLRVGVVLDKDATTKEWIRLQKQINDIEESTMRRRKKNSDEVQDGLGKQTSLVGKLNKEAVKTIGNFLKFTVVSSIFMAITQSIRGAFQLSVELNKSWTNFNIVAKASETQLAMVDAQINGLANSLGKLKTEIIDATTEFIRAGYSIEDSMIIAENGIMAANAGMVEMEDITKYLIAGLKSFKLEAEDSARVLDVLFSVANITAIDLEGIGEAFLRSANTLKFSGASLEESAALIAAANETIQDPAKVGTALKTIASRLRGVGEEGEVVPTLANDFKQVGVEIQNADGSFRDIYSIFSDFSKVYQNLDDLTKQSLIEKIAGKRQANILVGLLENFDLAQTSLETAYNSAGEVARANEQVVDSLNGRINILKNTVNELSQELFTGQGFKTFVEILTALVKLANFLTSGIVGVVSGIGLVLVGVNALKVAVGVLAGEVALATGGLSLLFGLLATSLGVIVTVNGGTETFGDTIEETASRLAELNSQLSTLETRIADLKAIKDRTTAEETLLGVYERQLATIKELAEIENRKLVANESEKTSSTIEDALSPLRIAQEARFQRDEAVRALENAVGTDAEFDEAFQQGFKQIIDAYEKEYDDAALGFYDAMASGRESLLSQLSAMYDIQTSSTLGGQAWQDAQKDIDKLLFAIEELEFGWDSFGVKVADTTLKLDENSEANDREAERLLYLNSVLIGASDNHDLLKSAIEQMTTSGYLTQDMIDSLIENGYGQLVSKLGEGKESFISFANVMLSGNRQLVQSELDKTNSIIDSIGRRIDGYEKEMKALIALAEASPDLTFDMTAYNTARARISEAKSDIANLSSQAGQLSNKLLELDSTESKKSSTSSTESSTKALTANERALRDVNQQIALNQKLQGRTSDDAEKIKLNNELIKLYQKQIKVYSDLKSELEANNKGITSLDKGYDEYIDTLYNYSLSIEDATNNIYGLTSANETMRESMYESVNELRELITSLVEQQLKDEIDHYKELIEQAKEQLDLKLKQLEAEKDLADFAKNRADKEEDIADIMSKMSSLRSAASQGDQRAINELAKLEDERATKQEELDKLINDRSYDLKKEGLQDQYEAYEDAQQKEIDTLEKNLNDASYIITRANQLMTDQLNGTTNTLYQSLVDWNYTYGTGFESDVLSKWSQAIELIKQFNALAGNTGTGQSFDFGNYNTGSYIDTVKKQMRENSNLWKTASAEEKKRLNQKNIGLAKSIGYSYRADGNYYSDTDGSKLIYDNGGYKPKGVEGYMAEGVEEWVLKDGQIKAMQSMAMMDVLSYLGKAGINGFNVDNSGNGGSQFSVNIYGDITDNNVSRIERSVENVAREVSKGQLDVYKTRGYKPSVSKR